MNAVSDEVCYLNTPIGWLSLTADAGGLKSVGFVPEPQLNVPPVSLPHLKEACRQLDEYFAGERFSFNLKLNPSGTAFQRSVWAQLNMIPFGTTISYKDLAHKVGCPGGARAVGMANNRNPLPIVVPCHRVVGHDGGLVGYAFGVEVKRRLLQLEGFAPQGQPVGA